MEQVTECFAKIEGLEFLFKVFSSSVDGLAVWNGSSIHYFSYGSVDRIIVRERVL